MRRRKCPGWCSGGHRCTARLGGEHTSPPEVWDSGVGRVVATRHLHTSGVRTSGGHVEIRIVVPLPEGEEEAVDHMRQVIAAAYYVISKVASGKGKD